MASLFERWFVVRAEEEQEAEAPAEEPVLAAEEEEKAVVPVEAEDEPAAVEPAAPEEEEEEPVDPRVALEEKCGASHHCAPLAREFEKCNARVASRPGTAETCSQELFDFVHCLDHCVSQKLFSKLK
eukprot:Opistho-2@47378